MQTSVEEKDESQNFSVIFSPMQKPVFKIIDPGRRVTVGSKTLKTLPAQPRGPQSHHSREAAASRARLRGETTTTTCPPKNGRAARHPARNVTAGRAGAAPAHHDPRATHPKPTTGRGRSRNASSTPRQRRRRRADAKKRRRGARQSDPTSEACVIRRPFRASQRRRSGGV